MDRSICIKAKYGNLIKKQVIFNEELSFDDLVMILIRIFNLKIVDDDEIDIRYKDQDGDLVCLENGNDLSMALSNSNNLEITVKVIKKGNSLPLANTNNVLKDLEDISQLFNTLKERLANVFNELRVGERPLTISDNKQVNLKTNESTNNMVNKLTDTSPLNTQEKSFQPHNANPPQTTNVSSSTPSGKVNAYEQSVPPNPQPANFSNMPFVPQPAQNQLNQSGSFQPVINPYSNTVDSKPQALMRPASQMSNLPPQSSNPNWYNPPHDHSNMNTNPPLNTKPNHSMNSSHDNVISPPSNFGMNYGPNHSHQAHNQSFNSPQSNNSSQNMPSYPTSNSNFNASPFLNQNTNNSNMGNIPINPSKIPNNFAPPPGAQQMNNDPNAMKMDNHNQTRNQQHGGNYGPPPPQGSNRYPVVSHPPLPAGNENVYQNRHN